MDTVKKRETCSYVIDECVVCYPRPQTASDDCVDSTHTPDPPDPSFLVLGISILHSPSLLAMVY